MALRLGVGDAFTVCKGAVDFCRTFHDEPDEVRSIVAEMQLIRGHLKNLESQIGEEKSFVTARPDIAPVMKRSLEPIHKDLLNVNQILRECKRKPSVHVVEKVRYLVLYKAKLDALREKLPAHRESICVMQELIGSQTPSERRASTVKLCELYEIQERNHKLEEQHDRAQEEVVQMFEQRHSCPRNGRHLSTTEMLEQLEDDLLAKGVSRDQAGKQLSPISEALLTSPLPTTLNRGPLSPAIQQPAFKLDIFGAIKSRSTSPYENEIDSSEVD